MWCCLRAGSVQNAGGQHGYRAVADIIVGVINLTFTVLAIMTVDNLVVSHCKLSAHSEWQSVCLPRYRVLHSGIGYCGATVDAVYVAAFAMSWGPVCWVLLSETSRMLFVVKRWQSRWRPSGWELLRLLDLPDDGQKLLAGGPFHNGFSYWIYGCMGVLAALLCGNLSRKPKVKPLRSWKPSGTGNEENTTNCYAVIFLSSTRASSACCLFTPASAVSNYTAQSDHQ